MGRTFGNVILLCILGGLAYVFRAEILSGWGNAYARFFPCKTAIEYSLGSFDARFGIAKEKFLQAVREAEAIWERPLGKDLFSFVQDGGLKVNLVYDYRQEATGKLRAIGLRVEDSQSSYDVLVAKYRARQQEFNEKQAIYGALIADVGGRTKAYNREVTEWNSKKGAPKDVYTRLSADSAALKEDVARAREMEADLRRIVDESNALVTVINQIANNINMSAEEFNKIGKERGEEFTEGLYVSDASGTRIDIYQFNDDEKLVRVLAHELGHALSLEHVEDPKAIMYRLNQGTNSVLSEADIAAVKKQCKIE